MQPDPAHQPGAGGALWPAGGDQAGARTARRPCARPQVPLDLPGVVGVEADDGAFNLALAGGANPQEVLRALLDRGVEVQAFEVAPVPLEDIFVAVVSGEEA